MHGKIRLISIIVLIVSFVLILFGGTAFLYQTGGLKYFRAILYVNSLPSEVKTKATEDFYGTSPNIYSGILAGVWNEKVWVWGKFGLKYFIVDKYSVYSFTDGCTQDILHPTSTTGDTIYIGRQVFFDLISWEKKIRTGDFVIVSIANRDGDGILGDLREVHDYNWWPFMQKDMQTECKK